MEKKSSTSNFIYIDAFVFPYCAHSIISSYTLLPLNLYIDSTHIYISIKAAFNAYSILLIYFFITRTWFNFL